MDDKALQKTKDEPKEAAAETTVGKKPFVTFGQNFHKWGTYLSIDWGLNYLTGVTFAMWGEYNKFGQKVWSEPLKKGAEFISTKMFRLSGPSAKLGALNAVRFLSIIAGGMFTIPPLMVLESKPVRKSMVQFFDKTYYGKEKVDNDPRFKEAYASMDQEHKQGFWTGLISRLGALAPLLAWVWVPALREKAGAQKYLDFVAEKSATTYNALGLTKERLFPGYKVNGVRTPHSPQELNARWKELHANSAMDFGLEPMYAVLHMIFYRGLAGLVGKFENKDHQKAQHEPIKVDTPSQDLPKREDIRDEAKPVAKVSSITREQHLKSVAQVNAL